MYKKGTCWEGYVQKGMKKKGNRMVPNCVPAGKMKTGGLTKWFQEKWVDIGAKKKGGKYQECGRKSASGSKRHQTGTRKRAAGNSGPKPTNVRT